MKNTKPFIICLLIIISHIVSCKQKIDNDSSKINKNKIEHVIKHKLTCQEIVEKLVKSSNLDLKSYEGFFIDIDNIENDTMLIHVYFENNLSDDPKQKQIVESTIAWLRLIPNEQKLYNITIDPEKPIELRFDKKILVDNDIFKSCEIKQDISLRTDSKYKLCILPFDFQEYYSICVYPFNESECNQNYPKYSFNEKSEIFNIVGEEFYFFEYMYLPEINNFKPIILCDNTSDTENYYLIITDNKKIISSLQIGKMDGKTIKDFTISKDHKIRIYSRKTSKNPRILQMTYKITNTGEILKI